MHQEEVALRCGRRLDGVTGQIHRARDAGDGVGGRAHKEASRHAPAGQLPGETIVQSIQNVTDPSRGASAARGCSLIHGGRPPGRRRTCRPARDGLLPRTSLSPRRPRGASFLRHLLACGHRHDRDLALPALAEALPDERHQRYKDYRKDDVAEVVLDEADGAEEVPGDREERHPGDAADDVVGKEGAVAHAAHAGHERGEGPDDRDEARQHDGDRAVPVVEIVCLVQIPLLQYPCVLFLEEPMPERVAYPVVHRVAQNRGRAYHRPEDEDVERVVRQRGDRRRRENQRVSGQERSDQQPGLAEDDQEHHQVCPHVVCAHKRLQVLVQVHEEINQPVQSKNLLASSNQVPILAYRPCPFNGGSGPELPCRWTCCRISPPGSGRHRMIRGEKTEQPRRRLVSAVNNPRLMVAIMFVCMWLVAILAVQRNHLLGVDAPKSRLLTLGGFLTGSARAPGISRLSSAVTSEFYAVLIAVLFLSYIWALVLVARGKATMSRGFIIGASVALCLWVLFITPLYAKDLFNLSLIHI